MGYTHYIYTPQTINDAAWKAITKDTKKLLAYVQKEITSLGDGLGKGKPVFTKDSIAFNGKVPNDYETAAIDRESDGRIKDGDLVFSFCKTAHRPYDVAVQAFYLIVRHYCPETQIHSDGEEEDWQDAVRLLNSVLDYPITTALSPRE